MKSVYYAKQCLYDMLQASGVRSLITGGIYKDKRPIGSKVEDIVINSIDGDTEILQEFILNVNCHVPYKQYYASPGGAVQYRIDNERLMQVFDIVSNILDDKYNDLYDCKIDRHEDFDIEEEKVTYINFRINLIIYKQKL